MNTVWKTLYSVLFTLTGSVALAQATQKQLVGDWALASVVNDNDGVKEEPYGPHPLGYLSLKANGRYSIQLQRADLPKIASNNRVQTTPQESSAIAQGVLSHYGRWKLVDPMTGEIAFHIEGSTFPNWTGIDQKRFGVVKGNRLDLKNPTSSTGGSAVVVWKRLK